MTEKTIRIWNGPKVLALLSVGQTGSTFSGATGGAANSTRVDIEIDPFKGLIVDHDTPNSPQDYREESDPGRGMQIGARDALLTMLEVLDGWVEGAKSNHEASQHRGEMAGEECWNRFTANDIRQMVKDAANEQRVELPGPS